MAVTEGDVPGLIMMKIMRHLAERTPFFGEWGEFDVPRNAMLISGGEIMDIDPLPCGECTVLVEVEKPIKEYVEQLVKSGFPHHCILVSGDIRRQLAQLADLMGVEKVFL